VTAHESFTTLADYAQFLLVLPENAGFSRFTLNQSTTGFNHSCCHATKRLGNPVVDRNIRLETEDDWAWCELVIISAMIIQKQDLRELIQKGVCLGKKVAVGGPFPTSVPEFSLEAGAHYL
jgi:hypothetical protein